MKILTPHQVEQKLSGIPHWEMIGSEISRNFVLTDFLTAIRFVNRIAELAEEAGHHPDILMHGWNNVAITLTTHSEDGLTDKDFELAGKIQKLSETM